MQNRAITKSFAEQLFPGPILNLDTKYSILKSKKMPNTTNTKKKATSAKNARVKKDVALRQAQGDKVSEQKKTWSKTEASKSPHIKVKSTCHADVILSPSKDNEACSPINLNEIESIDLMFTYKGKLYVLLPKPTEKNDARICMETALRLALDKHKATEVIDADIENLKGNLTEIAKEH
ncbi:MAG: hypothetical protein JEY96_01660 [Bacteroidales bacterium]|nr:hypothetical protein [Bacteroidales bacterium]